MKKILAISSLLFIACSREPLTINFSTITYIDQATHSDTIIVKYNKEYNDLEPSIYYAKKGWQTSTNASPQYGFKEYGIRTADSIFIAISPNTTIYNSYYFRFSADASILESQNILLLPTLSSKQTFIKL